MTKLRDILDKYKYPLLILVIGVALMLAPGSGGDSARAVSGTDTDALLTSALSCVRGVGEARVIVSQNGVVVVCAGAEDAKVRLDIIRAIQSYTGFGTDKITVLKLAEQS